MSGRGRRVDGGSRRRLEGGLALDRSNMPCWRKSRMGRLSQFSSSKTTIGKPFCRVRDGRAFRVVQTLAETGAILPGLSLVTIRLRRRTYREAGEAHS